MTPPDFLGLTEEGKFEKKKNASENLRNPERKQNKINEGKL